jgi:hypothetical protein
MGGNRVIGERSGLATARRRPIVAAGPSSLESRADIRAHRPPHHLPLEATMAEKSKRTTHRSTKGTKLYAVRDAKGRFKDIQSFKRAQGQDVRKASKKEK